MRRFEIILNNCLECPNCITDMDLGVVLARHCHETKEVLPKNKCRIKPPKSCPLEHVAGVS